METIKCPKCGWIHPNTEVRCRFCGKSLIEPAQIVIEPKEEPVEVIKKPRQPRTKK